MIDVYDLPERNRRAQSVITSAAVIHVGMDVGIGLGGAIAGMFVPGASLAATGASLIAQFPLYQKLARQLSEVYETPEDVIARRMRFGVMAMDTAYSVSADVTVPLAAEVLLAQFNGEFFGEIVRELMGEVGAGLAVSFIPIVGGFLAMGLDAAIAATMTWRVGLMVSAYYQNEGKWVNGSRKGTYDAVKDMPGGLSKETANRADLDTLADQLPEVFETQVRRAMDYITESVLDLNPQMSRDKVLSHLLKKGFPQKIAGEAVKRVMG